MNNSPNKTVVETYMQGFREGDHAKILDCLTDDVVWEMPGVYRHEGKEAFDKEIENEAFRGRPIIHIVRTVEEGNVVISEGGVRCQFRTGEWMEAVFCDVFLMRDGKIRQLTSYLMRK